MYKKRENHSIFTTSESRVNLVGNWDFGICLGWFWCSKISKNSDLIFFTRFLMKYRHFYTTYMNIDKFEGFFLKKKYFISIVLGEVVLTFTLNEKHYRNSLSFSNWPMLKNNMSFIQIFKIDELSSDFF